MLVSPIRLNALLTGLLSVEPSEGPHTALLITPQGQLLSHATVPDDPLDDEDALDEDAVTGAIDDVNVNGLEGNKHVDLGDSDADGGGVVAVDAEDYADAGDDEEPWLEGPERLRLLLGLASQWEEDESPRVECELGRLFLRPIALPEPEPVPPGAQVPSVRPAVVSSFVLVLNGTSRTPWAVLVDKADAFLSKWS